MKYLVIIIVLFGISCSTPKGEQMSTQAMPQIDSHSDTPQLMVSEDWEPVRKSPEEWQAELTEMEYYVLREKGTERSFTGDLLDNKEKGLYTCAGCRLPLFHSDTKFKSGTGWPSYYQPVNDKNVVEEADRSHGMSRVEVLCGRCGGHLGHVFDDGPKPTGLRYCINSVSLDFVRDSL